MRSMLISNHVAAGGVVGAIARRHPVAAFALGLASHFALDAVPHWGVSPEREDPDAYFMRVARRDGLSGLALMLAIMAILPRRAMVLALFGAVLPDLETPLQHFTGWRMFPTWFTHVHSMIQRESESRLRQEICSAVAGAAMCALVLRRVRRTSLRATAQ